MIRNIQSGNFSHSGRGKRLANEITAGIFQFSSSSFLCALFGSFSLSNFLLSSDTLCGKLKPQTTTLRNSKWILSARPTPPSPPLLPAHALGSGPGLGSVTETERVAKISALVSANGSQRDGERLINCSQPSRPPSALDTALLLLEH